MIKTDDIYFASYLISCGLRYSKAELINEKIYLIFFADSITEENEVEHAYDEGLGNVNVRDFIINISLITNIIYRLKNKI